MRKLFFICLAVLAFGSFCVFGGNKCMDIDEEFTAPPENGEVTLTPEEERDIITNLDLLENYDILIQMDFFENYDSYSLREREAGGERE